MDRLHDGKAQAQVFKAPAKEYPDTRLPAPVEVTVQDERLVRFQREFRMRMRNSPYFVRTKVIQKDIARYSDKYNQFKNVGIDIFKAIPTNPGFFPSELFPPTGKAKAKAKKKSVTINLDLNALSELEKEEEEGEEKKEGEEEEEEGDGEDAELSSEEGEEETDYNSSYFENGEDYGDPDDADEGATY